MAQGYGVDVSLTDKLVSGRLVSGAAIVVEAFYRRLITARGTLFYDLAYGFDVSGFVGAVGFKRAESVIAGMVENELSKDDRAYNVRCKATLVDEGASTQSLLLEIEATLVDSDESFSLTVGVTDLSAELLAAS
jgi:hypothetical protein